jgi:uncharacterized protein (UPF0276 family)
VKVATATPISTLLRDASPEDREQILALSDSLEVRDDRPIEIASSLPRICHCELSIVAPWSEEEVSHIASLVLEQKISYVSFHAHSCYVHPPVKDGMFAPEGTRMSEDEMLRNAANNIAQFRVRVGDSVAMAVENNNYFNTGAYDTVTDPAFLSRLIDSVGVLLLLDIAHAEITAKHTGVAFEEYLSKLPLDRVVQNHLSGPTRTSEKYFDSHVALTDTEWKQYKEIVPRCPNLKYVTIEYYKDATLFISMLNKLRTL